MKKMKNWIHYSTGMMQDYADQTKVAPGLLYLLPLHTLSCLHLPCCSLGSLTHSELVFVVCKSDFGNVCIFLLKKTNDFS